MKYIDCLNLINMSIKYDILKEQEGKVFVYRNTGAKLPKGWFLEDKDKIAKELMEDNLGQELLIGALEKQGLNFKLIKEI